jgi:hypothetical protein
MKNTYVYHRKSFDFIGDKLYSLNDIKTIHPSIYESIVKKYNGREWMLDISIPPLNCLWNDVIHTSLMHPSLIYKTLNEVGYQRKNLLWFEIPLADILKFPNTLYLNNREDKKVDKTITFLESEFESVNSNRISELSGMPDINLKYYRECFKKGEECLLFAYAPHVFFKGVLDISKYRVFDWKD